MSILSEAYFRDEEAALSKLEAIVWPHGPVCPHCGAGERIGRVIGKGARPGLKYCCHCRKQFRATMGTAFEHSHVPIHKWLQACYLLTAGETGISAHQLHLRLGVSNETATQIVRRILAANAQTTPAKPDGPAQHHPPMRTRWRRQLHPVRRPAASPDWHNPSDGGDPSCSLATAGRVTRQYLNFVAAAQELGCRDDAAAFDRTLHEIACRVYPPGRWQHHASFQNNAAPLTAAPHALRSR